MSCDAVSAVHPLLASLASATEEVFDTMLAIPLSPKGASEGPLESPANVVATVAFAGHRKGLVVVYSSTGVARRITSSMLGIALQDVNGEVPDAMGELANMVAGTFRNRLTAFEPPSDISVPTVTIGTEFSTLYSSAVHRSRYVFDIEGDVLSVELILTGEAKAA